MESADKKADAPESLAAIGASGAERSVRLQRDYSTLVKTQILSDFDTLRTLPALATLRSLRQWIAFQVTPSEDGKANKKPINPHKPHLTGAKSNDATTWGTLDEAIAKAKEIGPTGVVGFVFTENDPFCGIDFDHCRTEAGLLTLQASTRVASLDSYTEQSVTGTGVHTIILGSKPGENSKKGDIEIYDCGRAFIMTGRPINSKAIESRQEQLEQLYYEVWPKATEPAKAPQPARTNGPFRTGLSESDEAVIAYMRSKPNLAHLWDGDWQADGHPSRSEGEFALAGALLWRTGGSIEQTDRLFRQSGLYVEKWDRLGPKTMEKLLSTMKSFYDPTYHEPEPIQPEPVRPASPPEASKPVAKTQPNERWNGKDLMLAEFPPPRWLVPDMIPEGLVVLGGRPKLGKSWLALQLAVAVSSSGKFLDHDVPQGKVLYLAFEDSKRRIRERLWTQKASPDAVQHIVFRIGHQLQAPLQVLWDELNSDKYQLCVIDTFTRLAGRLDQNDVGVMSVFMSKIQTFAIENGMTVLMIDHHNKMVAAYQDVIDNILGSTGKSAPIDAAFGLYRERGTQNATLKSTGRDIEDAELALQWDPITCCWQNLGEADTVRKESARGKVLQAIEELQEFDQLATSTTIAKHLGMHQGNVSRELAELLRLGKIVKTPRAGKDQPYILSHIEREEKDDDIGDIHDIR